MHPRIGRQLTAEPWVALVVLHGEVEEVLLEALDLVGLRLHRKRPLHLSLLTCNHRNKGTFNVTKLTIFSVNSQRRTIVEMIMKV